MTDILVGREIELMSSTISAKKQREILFSIFSRKEKARLFTSVILQASLAILDLIGVALIGVIGAISIYGIQSKSENGAGGKIIKLLGLDGFTFQTQVAILGALAATVFIFKTLASLELTRRVLNYISRKGAEVTRSLLSTLLDNPSRFLREYSQQQIIYASTSGVQNLTTGMIGTASTIFSDSILLIVMFSGLLAVNFPLALTTLALFGTIGVILHRLMKTKAFALGTDESNLNIEANQLIWEVLNTHRESLVRNTRKWYVTQITETRLGVSQAVAKKNLMPFVGKYVMEIAMVLGSLILTAIQFAIYDATTAIASLTIFLAATSRVAPAVLRIQQGLSLMKNLSGTVWITTYLLSLDKKVITSGNNQINFTHTNFENQIKVENLSFTYGTDSNFHFKDLNLFIKAGSHVALVGPSGSGKSTLVDLILGVLTPTGGKVEISGLTPQEAFQKWPGAVAYVPQTIVISNGTIRENLCLGFGDKSIENENLENALEKAGLLDFISSQPEGLDYFVGDNGSRLSGGQQQRLCIARALVTNPKLIILDEATSSLDSITESEITHSISKLLGNTTVITIAHRLSTVRNAEQVVYLEGGQVIANGNFDFVRKQVPNFDKQAHLLGISAPTIQA
jgi:ATP-binding cassette subfamily C protein